MTDFTLTPEQVRAGREAHRASGTPMRLARWLAAHDAEVRASVLAEQDEPEWEYGQIRAVSLEEGIDHGPECGLEDCECPDHDGSPRPAGTYVTVRLDGGFDAMRPWRIRMQRLPVEEGETP